MTSVPLSAVPYTGFDYGQPMNTFFWVVLVLWSMLVTALILRKGATIARGINNLAGALRVVEPVPASNPRILHERIVPQEVPQKTVPPPLMTTPSRAVQEQVRTMVDDELAVSRVDASPDEFTEDDFSTVDFDGINPDDSWVPRAVAEVPRVESYVPKTHVPQQEAPRPTLAEPPRVPEEAMRYTDTLTLDSSGDTPQLVLVRSAG